MEKYYGVKTMAKKSVRPQCSSTELHSSYVSELESQEEWDALRCNTDAPRVKCENFVAEAD